MSLYNGSDKIKDLYIGPTKIKELYVGSTKVYSSQQELPWTQPVLSANGTIGGNSFACAASSNQSTAYKVFDNSTSSAFVSTASQPSWIEWYNPYPLKISQIKIATQLQGVVYQGALGDFYIQVSDDGINWTTVYTGSNRTSTSVTVNLSLSDAYKYWRLYCLNAIIYLTAYTNQPVEIDEITITATQIV